MGCQALGELPPITVAIAVIRLFALFTVRITCVGSIVIGTGVAWRTLVTIAPPVITVLAGYGIGVVVVIVVTIAIAAPCIVIVVSTRRFRWHMVNRWSSTFQFRAV